MTRTHKTVTQDSSKTNKCLLFISCHSVTLYDFPSETMKCNVNKMWLLRQSLGVSDIGLQAKTTVIITTPSATSSVTTMKLNKTNDCRIQWLKCNGTQGNAVQNAVHPPPIYGSKRSPTSDCYNARERHTTIVRGPKPECSVPPPLILHFNHWQDSSVVCYFSHGPRVYEVHLVCLRKMLPQYPSNIT